MWLWSASVAGQMPTLELRTVLERTACELQENEAVIIEEAHEGLPMVGVGFRSGLGVGSGF